MPVMHPVIIFGDVEIWQYNRLEEHRMVESLQVEKEDKWLEIERRKDKGKRYVGRYGKKSVADKAKLSCQICGENSGHFFHHFRLWGLCEKCWKKGQKSLVYKPDFMVKTTDRKGRVIWVWEHPGGKFPLNHTAKEVIA